MAIQVASGQYTPRIIATTLLRNNVIRYTVGLFVFSFIFAIKALNRIETSVPQFAVFLTGLLGFACIAIFLFLVDYAARLLRPVSLVRSVGEAGLAVIDSIYPDDYASVESPTEVELGESERTVLYSGTSAIILAVHVKPLLAEAQNLNGIIEVGPQVGDFIGAGEPLFRLHGGASSIDDHKLEECIIFGSERTLEQDPLFAFRILVDIAIKALSPAINDPTTAVLAIDQLHRLLRRAGRRNLRTDYLRDREGERACAPAHAELGRLRPSGLHRDSFLWCREHSNCAAGPGHDHESGEHAAGEEASRAATGTRLARSHAGEMLHSARRLGAGTRARHARLGWINGRKCVSMAWVNCDRAPNDAKIA